MIDRRVRYSDEQLQDLVKIATERLGLDAVIDAADAVPDDPMGHDYCIIPVNSNQAIGEHRSEGAAMKAAISHAERYFTDVRVARVISKVTAEQSLNADYLPPEVTQKKFAASYALIILCIMVTSVIFVSTARAYFDIGSIQKVEDAYLPDGTRCVIIDRMTADCEKRKK